MAPPLARPLRRHRTLLAVALTLLASLVLVAPPALAEPRSGRTPHGTSAATSWSWPVSPMRIMRPFVAPAHEYGPGHRGIDLAASLGQAVRAPAPGVVAFAGAVAGRGVVTIDHGGGWVTTLEPVDASVSAGASVSTGDQLGTVSEGGHTARGDVHFGVRHDGRYINPLVLLGGAPRAVLLPCC